MKEIELILEIINEHVYRNEDILQHFDSEDEGDDNAFSFYEGQIEALLKLKEELMSRWN